MNNESSLNLYGLMSIAWRKRYLVLAFSILLPVATAAICIIAPKTYYVNSSILINKATGKSTRMMGSRTTGYSRALLTSPIVLKTIAENAGIIDKDISKDQLGNALKRLAAGFFVTSNKGNVMVWYKSQDKKAIAKILQSAVFILQENLELLLIKYGGTDAQLAKVITHFQSNIAKAATSLTNLRAQYTNNHSKVQLAQTYLVNLQRDVNNLLASSMRNLKKVDTKVDIKPIQGSLKVKFLGAPMVPASNLMIFAFILFGLVALTIAGFSAGLAAVYLLTKNDPSIRLKSAILETTGFNVLSRIPSHS